jgi:hypothetical protein
MFLGRIYMNNFRVNKILSALLLAIACSGVNAAFAMETSAHSDMWVRYDKSSSEYVIETAKQQYKNSIRVKWDEGLGT